MDEEGVYVPYAHADHAFESEMEQACKLCFCHTRATASFPCLLPGPWASYDRAACTSQTLRLETADRGSMGHAPRPPGPERHRRKKRAARTTRASNFAAVVTAAAVCTRARPKTSVHLQNGVSVSLCCSIYLASGWAGCLLQRACKKTRKNGGTQNTHTHNNSTAAVLFIKTPTSTRARSRGAP